MKINNIPAYLHIPFCAHLCAYCDFAKLLYQKDFVKAYLSALFLELKSYEIKEVPTIYIGGGTPTSLSEEELESLLTHVAPLLAKDGEFSIECSPDTLTPRKLEILRRYGVNRLSMGVESFNDELLSLMERPHHKSDIDKVVKQIKEAGFTNFSLDLIYGLPHQTLAMFKEDLETLLSYNPPHFSAYSLTVHPGTKFFNKGFKEADDGLLADAYNYMVERLTKEGYRRYEVSNFAREGYECQHNLYYWRNLSYYGLGLGASGYLNDKHYTNTRNLSKYLKGEYVDFIEGELSLMEKLEYYLLTHLRLEEGFSLEELKEEFAPFYEGLITKLALLEDKSLVKSSLGRISLTPNGFLLADYVIRELTI